jgi:RecA/RadA recombinase
MGRGRPRKIKPEETSGDLTLQNEINQAESKLSSLENEQSKEVNIPMTEPDPKLKKVVNELSKIHGSPVIHFANEEEAKERIPTKIESLDKLIKGFVAGAFNVIWGGKSSTKTTTCYYTIAEAQKLNKVCLFADLEHSFDAEYAAKCGVDCSKLLLATDFNTAEEAMDAIIKLCNEKVIDLVIVDSVQALSPTGEQEEKSGKEKSIADDEMGLIARKLSKFFRVSGTGVYRGKVTFILIAQTRIDLGKFIKLETLSGGNALAHYATIIVKMYRAGKADSPQYKFKVGDKNKSFPIGFKVCYCLEKKKISGCAPEKSTTSQDFYNEFGFRKPSDEEIKNLYKDWIEFEEGE